MTFSKGQNDSTGESACNRCGNRSPHSEIAAAACAYDYATGKAIRELAAKLGCLPVDAVDLLAHLRSVFTPAQAYAATRYVLELGWRPSVGVGTSA